MDFAFQFLEDTNTSYGVIGVTAQQQASCSLL